MTKLILCEGKTDALLLSYYLKQVCGWEYTKKSPKGIQIQAEDGNGESANWYQLKEDHLLICGVGGKSQFKIFF